MSMSRRDFQAVAEALASVRPNTDSTERPTWDACEQAIIAALKTTNPFFDHERFAAWAEGQRKPPSIRSVPFQDRFGPDFDGSNQ